MPCIGTGHESGAVCAYLSPGLKLQVSCHCDAAFSGFHFLGRNSPYFQKRSARQQRHTFTLFLVTLIVTAALTLFVTLRRSNGFSRSARRPFNPSTVLIRTRQQKRRRACPLLTRERFSHARAGPACAPLTSGLCTYLLAISVAPALLRVAIPVSHNMIVIYKERPSYAYTAIVCLMGVAALAASLIASSVPLWDARYLLIAFCATTAGTLLYVKVPRAGAIVPLSSVFVLVAAIFYGVGAAVTLAAAVALVASLRLSRSGLTLLCDSALAAAVTFCSVEALLWLDGGTAFGSALLAALVVAACSLIQATAESLPVAVYGPGAGGRFSLRLYVRALGWTAVVYLIPSSVGVLAAWLPHGYVLDATLALAVTSAAAYTLCRVYRSSVFERQSRSVEPTSPDIEAITNSLSLYAAFNYAAIGMAILSSKGKLLRVNRSMCNFLGYTESELMCSSLQAITQQEDLGPALAGLKSVLKRHSDFLQIEVRHKRRGGERVWALWNVARFQDQENEETYLILPASGHHGEETAEQQLRYDAFHDPLTGLPNRALFIDHVKLSIASARKEIPASLFAVSILRPGPLQDHQRLSRPHGRRPAYWLVSPTVSRTTCAKATP